MPENSSSPNRATGPETVCVVLRDAFDTVRVVVGADVVQIIRIEPLLETVMPGLPAAARICSGYFIDIKNNRVTRLRIEKSAHHLAFLVIAYMPSIRAAPFIEKPDLSIPSYRMSSVLVSLYITGLLGWDFQS